MKKTISIILLLLCMLLTGCGINSGTVNTHTPSTTPGDERENPALPVPDSPIQIMRGDEIKVHLSSDACDPHLANTIKALDSFLTFIKRPNGEMMLSYHEKKVELAGAANSNCVVGIYYKACFPGKTPLDILTYATFSYPSRHPNNVIYNDMIVEDLRDVVWTSDWLNQYWHGGYANIGKAYYYWNYQMSAVKDGLYEIMFETGEFVVCIHFLGDKDSLTNCPELEPYLTLSTAPDAINAMIAAANGETVQ